MNAIDRFIIIILLYSYYTSYRVRIYFTILDIFTIHTLLLLH